MSWIKCSERLPEKYKSYLGVVIGRSWGKISHKPLVEEVLRDSDCWTDNEGIDITVTHWMPMPDLPTDSL